MVKAKKGNHDESAPFICLKHKQASKNDTQPIKEDYMRQALFIILTIVTLNSCRHEYKQCNCISSDNQVKIYSDILNELVEHHFYNRYLGKEGEQILSEYFTDFSDTTKVRIERIRLQNKLFNDTARFCNIYLDTVFTPYFKQWTHYQNDTGRFARKFNEIISAFTADGQSVIDSLNSMQLALEPSELQLCTSNALSLRDSKSEEGTCEIGIISFSKVFFDRTKTKGLLYYNFECGGLCGKGELLVIKQINNRWTIVETVRTWIS